MPKKKDTEVENFEDFEGFEGLNDVEELEETNFDSNMFGSVDEQFDDQFEETGLMADHYDQPSEPNIGQKVIGMVQDNKLAAAGVVGAIGLGVWQLFGKKSQQDGAESQAVNQEYQDELLGLDEEDSIDEFIESRSRASNPMFQPLRFR